MLRNRYQEIIFGMGLMSLIRGLVSTHRQRSTLLIDDPSLVEDCYFFNFLSELDILALIRLGENYDIPELKNLRQFLIPANIWFKEDQFQLKLGASPHQNLIELLRKFPNLIEASDLDLVYQASGENFNQGLLNELARFEQLCFDSVRRRKAFKFEINGPTWLKTIYTRFGELLNLPYLSQQNLRYSALLHLSGLAAEEKLKTCLYPEELPFYFFRTLSPIYRLQDFFLTTQLKRRLLMRGGDYKESSVQYWQLHDKKFENLLLASFEGVISGERVLFFHHPGDEVPFKLNCEYPLFKKYQMSPQKRVISPHPPHELKLMTSANSLGTDHPYRAMVKGGEMVFYHWPYPDLPGSKAEFYKAEFQSSFEADLKSLPLGVGTTEAKGIQSVSLDLRQIRSSRKSEEHYLTRLPLELISDGKPIRGFEYWGPFRYRTLGLLGLCYGIEEI